MGSILSKTKYIPILGVNITIKTRDNSRIWGLCADGAQSIFLCAIFEGCAPYVRCVCSIYMYKVYAPNITDFISMCHFRVINIDAFILRQAGIFYADASAEGASKKKTTTTFY